MYCKYYFIILLLIASPLSSTTITVFSGTSGTQDSYMDRGQQTTNFGSADSLEMQNGFSTFTSAMIKAIGINDTIPTNANVTNCYVRLHIRSMFDANNKQLVSFGLCKPWVESEVTHTVYKFLTGWNVTGAGEEGATSCIDCNNTGSGTGDDYILDSALSPTFNDTGWVELPIPLCFANGWVSGDFVNNGIKIFDNGLFGNFVIFTIHSSEHGTFAPEIVFEWELPPTGVPNVKHSISGSGVKHSTGGASVKHGG